jgi:hypothetical protein
MSKGGRRPGAGRKLGSRGQNTKQAETLKAYFIQEFVKRKEEIFTALLNKAATGDVAAIREANERAMGKVPAAFEADTDGNMLLPFQLIVKPKVYADNGSGAVREAV